MALTTPDNIWTPDAGEQYALTTDLATTADSIQNAITKKANYGVGTTAEMNAAVNRFPDGAKWYNTTNDTEYRRVSGAWTADSGALETYTPTLTASTNPNLGSGSTFIRSGRYWRTAGGMINVQIILRFGSSGVSAGSGNYDITLPIPIDTNFHTVQNITGASDTLGSAVLRDQTNTSGVLPGTIYAIDANTVRIVAGSGSGVVSSSTPWTWASGDAMALTVNYKADL